MNNKLISEGSYQKILDAWGNGAGAKQTPKPNHHQQVRDFGQVLSTVGIRTAQIRTNP